MKLLSIIISKLLAKYSYVNQRKVLQEIKLASKKDQERCPSGLWSRSRKAVPRKSGAWVQIPPSPPVGKCFCWLALCEDSPADFKRKLEFFIFARGSEQAKSGLPSLMI